MKHVLITGAANRIGRAIALHLARQNWEVTIHYNKSEEAAQLLKKEICEKNGKANIIQANFEQLDDTDSLFSCLPAPVNALIHNASLFLYNEHDLDGNRHWKINFEIPTKLTESFVKQVPQEADDASVLYFLDSTTGSLDYLSQYNKTRLALGERLHNEATQYASQKVRVNGISLGPSLRGDKESEAHFAKMVAATPLKRASAPKHLVGPIELLLTNPIMTGQILYLDSGLHL